MRVETLSGLFCFMVSREEESVANLWGAREVAEFLGVSRSLVYQMAKDGKLPHVKLADRAVRFVPDELLRWVRENSHPGAAVSK